MQQQNGFLGMIFPIVVFVLVFYFLIIRPQRKRQKEHENLIASLRRGDQVVTIGGLFGTVKEVKDDSFILEVDEGVKVRVLKSAISFKRAEAPAQHSKAEEGKSAS